MPVNIASGEDIVLRVALIRVLASDRAGARAIPARLLDFAMGLQPGEESVLACDPLAA